MLGWEFPPIINGGLGVACLGMAKALSKHADLSIILPKTDPDFLVDNVELIGLNNISADQISVEETEKVYKEFSEVEFVDTSILPYPVYQTEEKSFIVAKEKEVTVKESHITKTDLSTFQADDLYGEDVVQKVQEYAKYALALAKKKDFDVIHAHDWMTFLAGIYIKHATGKPLVLHVHSLSYDRTGPEGRGWIYDVEVRGMQEADLIIPVSNYTSEVCKNHLGADASKLFPVHNGVELVEAFKEESSFPEKLVLFLGRVTLQKGPEIFLEIASKVMEECKDVRFVMAGTGDKLKRIIESGAYKQVGNKFHFTGFLNKEKVNHLLSIADVYCMPSVSEPFGLSALEAAQFGVPAVISKQSGVAEVLTSALKADFWDVDLMAEHIVSLLEDEKLKEKVVKESYDNLASLTWDDAASKIMNVFHEKLAL